MPSRDDLGTAHLDPPLARVTLAAEARAFPCPLVIKGGSNVPEGQSLVGMFAYRLVSEHWRVHTG